jgi:phosphate transport system permease protein
MSAAGNIALGESGLFDPTAPLTGSGNLRRRAFVSRVVQVTATVAALIAVALLVIVVYGVVVHGASSLSASFVVQNPSGLAGGGIANALLGTLEIVAAASVIALPLGVLTGLYLTEFAGARSRSANAIKFALDVMQGLPTIVVGLFVYGLLVIPLRRDSGLAAAVALAIVMLPLMARSSQEVLLLVPGSLREAADALGVSRWRTVLTVILPAALSGIATGAILAIARGAGETAPLLICDGIFNPNTTSFDLLHGVPSVPMFIYTSFDLPLTQAVARAWGASLVLMVFILFANVIARVLLARSRAKMGP